MTTQQAPTTGQGERITCSIPGPRNDFGKPKLLATITQEGVLCWCKHCRMPHLVARERIERVWNDFKSHAFFDECIEDESTRGKPSI